MTGILSITRMADKIEVRKHIGAKLGVGYSVPLLGTYDSFDEIAFAWFSKSICNQN